MPDMKEEAVSKAQQRFMGMVRAEQKGEMKNASPEVKEAAASMKKKMLKSMLKPSMMVFLKRKK